MDSSTLQIPSSPGRRLAERRGTPKLQLASTSSSQSQSLRHSPAQSTLAAAHSRSLSKSTKAAAATGGAAPGSASRAQDAFAFTRPASHRTLSLPSRSAGAAFWNDDNKKPEPPRLASLTERRSAELLGEIAAGAVAVAPLEKVQKPSLTSGSTESITPGGTTATTPTANTIAGNERDFDSKIQSLAETLQASSIGRSYQDSITAAAVPATYPSTPSGSCDAFFFYPTGTSGSSSSRNEDDYQFDLNAFSSAPPTPISPSIAETSSSGRSRASTLLHKVIPQKFRDGIKRRMTGGFDKDQQPVIIPTIDTMPIAVHYRAQTPEEDFDKYFGTATNATTSSSTVNDSGRNSPVLPPLLVPFSSDTPTFDTEESIMPRKSAPTSFTHITDAFVDVADSSIPAGWVASPLHPPTISPTLSPGLDGSFSQQYVKDNRIDMPVIYPTSPMIARRPPTPVDFITADSLADMIETARREDAAYEAAYKRMLAGGWSTEQELNNVKLQRHEAKRDWEYKIAHGKKLLEVIKRHEVLARRGRQYGVSQNKAGLMRSSSEKSYTTIRPGINGRTQSR